MRFPRPPKNVFLAPLGRFRAPKSRRIKFVGPFLAPPSILRGIQNRPKSPKWSQNARKEPTPVLPWRAPGADLLQGSILGAVFDNNSMIFDTFLMICWAIVSSFLWKSCKTLASIWVETNVVNRCFPQISILVKFTGAAVLRPLAASNRMNFLTDPRRAGFPPLGRAVPLALRASIKYWRVPWALQHLSSFA